MSLTINLGMEDFKTLREGHRVYVDKTVFIQNLFATGTDDDTNTTNDSEEMISQGDAQVTLITRPRRFGKTLTLSTLNIFRR